ncbi:ABC transporter ATP-binding protein [Paenibacillus xylaniclasticus]|uniref:ABC transporter ATP-binding protein n=1 Tax=Paenibacillus xylaniclasticus TaxID=588083 RepID=UPI000FDB3C55|nr:MULTISPECIES: ABC transporter ATP-binding protein [Paenibacillus]GFN30217.1 ABC transporter ATP-binding protein [Paenibacillus curdlanolyticus]
MTASQARETLVTAEGVTRIFGKGESAVTALKAVSFTAQQGTITALRGRSGSGKTTLLNIIGALDRPSEGKLWLGNEDLTAMTEKQRGSLRRQRIGLVFQSYGLIPLMSAYENVEFGLRIAGVPSSRTKKMAEEALEQVGMKERMKHRPGELSGGEQQRVAIARAIAHHPVLLLADEPTAELDSKTGLTVIRLFRDLVDKLGMTIIMTTHDLSVLHMMDQTIALEDGHIGRNNIE